MPLYDIRCEKTGACFERFIKLEDFKAPINCACGARANRLISSPLFTVDNTSYTCPVTGRYISSKRDHRENLLRTNSRVLETGEKELNERHRQAVEEAFDKKIEETVEREIDSYSSDRKEQLHNELVNGGLDAVIERK